MSEIKRYQFVRELGEAIVVESETAPYCKYEDVERLVAQHKEDDHLLNDIGAIVDQLSYKGTYAGAVRMLVDRVAELEAELVRLREHALNQLSW